jgi:hypothetical protein
MRGTRSRTARGLVVLAVAGGLSAGALLVPAGAASFATKKFVKKQVNRAINKLSSQVIHQPVFYRQSAPVTLAAAAGAFDEAFVACPAGTSPLGGGVAPSGIGGPPPTAYSDVNVEASHPSTGTSILAGTTGWSVGVENDAAVATSFRAYVICAAVQKDSNFAEGSPPARPASGSRSA